MHTRIGLTLAALMGASACGAPDEPSDAGAESGGAEDIPPALRSFEVSLDEGTTTESVIPQILEAGRPELAAACADRPEALIRIYNPLDPGAFTDMPCAASLGGAEAAEGSVVPASAGDEPIEATQQRWSPFSLGCAAFILGSTLIATREICPRATNPRAARHCNRWSDVGFGTLTLMCAFF
ncbi:MULTISPECIES: hypothetical protein [Sorangium]|uniref:Uncharacterized protein n=1 Tax=Sorangium cellulosum TaxID=56 RepID=A0A4P2QYP7_SORCE|nr:MULTISPECIES: hypothetical protein [Sorangium]AUX35697.1 uncharacterized protein SOCE836_078950 [Sorangium cellulosum]WCQ94996.1 hypothetical protein NQZ70_07771 [Sorangium sp. Soce836]